MEPPRGSNRLYRPGYGWIVHRHCHGESRWFGSSPSDRGTAQERVADLVSRWKKHCIFFRSVRAKIHLCHDLLRNPTYPASAWAGACLVARPSVTWVTLLMNPEELMKITSKESDREVLPFDILPLYYPSVIKFNISALLGWVSRILSGFPLGSDTRKWAQ